METWQRVWREGLVPHLPLAGLEALRQGLRRDDPRLLQGRTMTPPPLVGLDDAEIEGACALGYCGWYGAECTTVAALDAFFTQLCMAVDEALGEPAVCRHFLDWYDATPRSRMRRLLLAEVEHALHALHASCAA